MNVSMNGLRKNLSNATKDLMEQVAELIKKHEEYEGEYESLIKRMDEVRGYVGTLNCISNPDDKDFQEIDIHLPWMEDLLEHEETWTGTSLGCMTKSKSVIAVIM